MTSRLPILNDGQLIGGCRILQFLGRGGMGEVYLAEHLRLAKPVAVKILPPDFSDREGIERFVREARMCSRIDHPNVVTILDVDQEGSLYYIVMQYVRGKNLSELLEAQRGPLPWRSAVRMVQLACHGLHAVHARGLVHRDIKPSNIMLSTESRVFLMDFGLVREEVDSTLSRPGMVAGTPPFMSPEQAEGRPLDRRSDIFSMGSTLYCLLAGRPPYGGATPREIALKILARDPPPPLQQFNPHVPAEVSAVVTKAMSPDPADRFSTAVAMARQLRNLLQGARGSNTLPWQPPAMEPEPPIAVLVPTEIRPGTPVELPPPGEPLQSERELLPLHTTEEPWKLLRYWPAVAGGLALLVGLLSWGVAQKSKSPSAADRAGMVRIEAGAVQIGDAPERLRAFLSMPARNFSAAAVEARVKMLAREEQERLEVGAFWIDKYEVTNAQYLECIQATGRAPPGWWKGPRPRPDVLDCPVTGISYEDAEAYAEWKGKRLPSRSQWMRAYRGDGNQLFPWGDAYDPSRANVGENPKYRFTSPVTATPDDVSPWGVYNLVGNASEFVRGTVESKGKKWRLVKGGEYKMEGAVWGISSGHQLYGPEFVDQGTGFRCVVEE